MIVIKIMTSTADFRKFKMVKNKTGGDDQVNLKTHKLTTHGTVRETQNPKLERG